ncbi:sodium-dependent transporter [Haloarcula sp. S1AR25-5A]|uniref:Sodium-dependent transporter n=1 Tax=Haloarcula terrestris TaxID=2950533 RepID=A0AAE4JJM2_9EURY|nr:sodium-dependent transporter [Haloarcula terrestris]MDS0223850.1 sodium-dependent transporter [Haloarcula terrestris]
MQAARWSSQAGFLLATVGAAVGLGNIWRFSAVVGQNGGGAYLIPYLIAAFLCAVPMLILELSIGRRLRTDVVSAFRSVKVEYTPLGWLILGGVLLILSYYLVLTGWVLGFFLSWLAGSQTTFESFTASWLPIGYFVVATVVTGGVVSMGVRGGIERMAKVVMPTVFALLIALALYAVTLAEWDRAAVFLFTPDFSVLTDLGIWSAAFGQVFFSLSVGQGIMLTYGSYVEEGADLFKSSFVITIADIAAALVAGLVIFPIVFSFGLQPTLGTELAFTTLPTAFATMPFGRIVAVGFFGLLFFAALSSAVALLEVGVAAAESTTRLSRPRATLFLTGGVFVAGIPSALSYSPINLAVAGRPILDLVDESVGTFALPISALLIVFVFVWATDIETVHEELGQFYPVVRYLIPVVLVVITTARTVGIARPAWRLIVDHTRNGPLGLLVTAVLLLAFAILGWELRDRL